MHRFSTLLLLLAACPAADPAPVCEADPVLFGAPSAMTGLGADQCGPTCACDGEPWIEPVYTEADIQALRAWTPAAPVDPVLVDPYEDAAPAPPGDDAVCAVITSTDRTYRLADYATARDAERDGAQVTHAGSCGVCSTLQDLSVYMEHRDLTDPVRQCGLDHLTGPMDDHVACLQELGFTLPCAQIWYWNTRNTRAQCAADCFALIDAPYHTPDGALNACLQCDEDTSGPVFQAVAGRTRRNTGLASTMCRPCDQVRRIEHRYR